MEKVAERGRLQSIRGIVISDKMNKTRVIEVSRTIRHLFYHKRILRESRIFVHDEKNESKIGDLVLAAHSRPLSRHKHFRMVRILEKKVEQ